MEVCTQSFVHGNVSQPFFQRRGRHHDQFNENLFFYGHVFYENVKLWKCVIVKMCFYENVLFWKCVFCENVFLIKMFFYFGLYQKNLKCLYWSNTLKQGKQQISNEWGNLTHNPGNKKTVQALSFRKHTFYFLSWQAMFQIIHFLFLKLASHVSDDTLSIS